LTAGRSATIASKQSDHSEMTDFVMMSYFTFTPL